jgi:hypothetical protein
MKTLREYKEQILTTTMVALFPTMLTLCVVFDLCKHCPGH